MGKVAFMFPGQASQYPGMGKELADTYPAAKSVFDEADKALGFSISKMCFEGSEEDLKLTDNTQPAILTCSVATYRVLEEKGLAPDFVVGHSLGEYSALVADWRAEICRRRTPGAQARHLHAGSGARRQRRHGRHHGAFARGGRRRLQARRRWTSLLPRELEFSRADRNFRPR